MMLLKWVFLIGCTIVNERVLAQNLNISTRIVNGHDVRPGERPFQVSLQSPGPFCGGSIINSYFILTAAHCTTGKKASSVKVLVGTVDLTKGGKRYQASKIIIHRMYSKANSFKNDISLIKVSGPIVFSTYVKPVLLPRFHEDIRAGTYVIVSGWGRLLNSESARPNILQEVQLQVNHQDYCRKAVNKQKYNLYSTQLCASGNGGIRKGDCNGDSGGPLTANNKLVGIVSWSIKDPDCGSTEYPNVYTRVSDYIDWIRNNQN